MRCLVTVIAVLHSLCSLGQEAGIPSNSLTSRQTFFDDLQYQRIPDVIVTSWGKLKGKTESKVVYDNPALRVPHESICYIYTSKSKVGYLHINRTIESTMDSTDMRKVEYYLNGQAVNTFKQVKKLFKLKLRDIQALQIDTDPHLEFVRVYIALSDKN